MGRNNKQQPTPMISPLPPPTPPTFSLDPTLPRIPLPTLQDTLRHLRTAVLPFCQQDTKQINELDVALSDAVSSLSQAQAALQRKHAQTNHYFDDWWTNVAYLSDRSPIVPQESSGCEFTSVVTQEISNSLRAALLIAGISHIYDELQSQTFPVFGVEPNIPFTMKNFRNIFQTCRIPGIGTDTIERHFKTRDEEENGVTIDPFVIVGHMGLFYTVSAAHTRTVGAIMADIDAILEQQQQPNPVHDDELIGAGLFTTLDRDTWAKIRAELLLNPTNVSSLHTMSRALCVLTFDASTPWQTFEILHDMSISPLAESRWYDKAFQLVIFNNQQCGFSMEHSCGDAAAPNAILYDLDMWQKSWLEKCLANGCTPLQQCQTDVASDTTKTTWQKLPLVCNSAFIATSIVEARMALTKRRKTVWHITQRRFHGVGKRVLKPLGISPDSFVQVALQVAFAKDRGIDAIPESTYETVGMLKWRDARTEAGRSVTMESLQLQRMFLSTNGVIIDANLIRRACQAHATVIKTAGEGHGIDRHLFALKCQCAQLGHPLPKLFSLPAFLRATTWELSTSHAFAKGVHEIRGGSTFRPFSPTYTGVVYSIQNEYVDLTVMSPKHDVERFVGMFAWCVARLYVALRRNEGVVMKSTRSNM